MSEQLPLPGLPPAPTSDRLFLAIRPDRDGAARAVALARDLAQAHGLAARPIPRERLHVSLFRLAPDRPLEELVAAAGAATAGVGWPAFDLAFDRAASFGKRGNRPLVVFGNDGASGLLWYGEVLREALQQAGLGGPARAWTPHMTLLYDRSGIAAREIEPIRWRVDEVVLLRSLVGQGRHVVLGRWPLAG